MRLIIFILIWFFTPLIGYGQKGKASLVSIGVEVLAPVSTYSSINTRSYVGANLSFLSTIKIKDVYVGGSVGYGIYDQYTSVYPGTNMFGQATNYREDLYNSQFFLSIDFRYMPFISRHIQPYLGGGAGIRRVATFLVTTDVNDNVQAGNQVFERDWAFQVQGSIGCIIPLKTFLSLDISIRYLETQAMTHFVRKRDWRDLDPFWSTDLYESKKASLQLMGFNASILYAF